MPRRVDHFQVFPVSDGDFISFFVGNGGFDRWSPFSEKDGHAQVIVIYAFKVGFVDADFSSALFRNGCSCGSVVVVAVGKDNEFQVGDLYVSFQLLDDELAAHSRIYQDLSVNEVDAGIISGGADILDFHGFPPFFSYKILRC